jgi:hypothetical protein
MYDSNQFTIIDVLKYRNRETDRVSWQTSGHVELRGSIVCDAERLFPVQC